MKKSLSSTLANPNKRLLPYIHKNFSAPALKQQMDVLINCHSDVREEKRERNDPASALR